MYFFKKDSPFKTISFKKRLLPHQIFDPTKQFVTTELEVYHETQKDLFCGKHALQLHQENKKPMTVSFFGDIATQMHNNEKQILGPNIPNNHQQVVGLKRDPIGNYSFEVVSTALDMTGCNLVHVPTAGLTALETAGPTSPDAHKLFQEKLISAWGLDQKKTIGFLFNVQKFIVSKYQKMQQTNAHLKHPQLLQSFFQGISEKSDQTSLDFSTQNKNATDKKFVNNEVTLLPGVEIEKQPAGGHWWTIGKIFFSVSGKPKKNYVWVDHDSMKDKPSIFESLSQFHDYLRAICRKYGIHDNKTDNYVYELNVWRAEITNEDDFPSALSAAQTLE